MANNRELSQFGAFVEVDNSTLGITTSVGINKSSPGYTLDVNGDINFTGILYENGNQYYASRWTLNGTNIYRDSNVGIKVQDPQQALDVNGTVLATQLSTGASGTGINVTTNSITGPATLIIDPAAVEDDTGTVQIKGNLTVLGTTTTINSTTTTFNQISLGDNEKIQIGDSNDLEIYHDGTHSWIWEQGPGNLYLRSNGGSINLRLNSTDMVVVNEGSSVQLLHNTSKKFETSSTGITVTGTVVADGISLGDAEQITLGASNDLKIFEDTSDGHLQVTNGNIFLRTDREVRIMNDATTKYIARFDQLSNGRVLLYYDNGLKFETTNTGVTVTGTAVATTFSGSGASLTNIPNSALDNSSVSFGGVTLSLGGSDESPAFDLSDSTGLPISTGVSGLATGIATFLSTPSSANLISAVTDETGTGSLVFATSPTLVTPVLGAASATSISATGNISGETLTSTVAVGTAPLTVTSTTKVTNLNADLLDDQEGSYYLNYTNFTNTPTIGNGTLTLNVSGTGLSGSQTFTANQTSNVTFTVTSNATSSNTASTIVSRDASGNFTAGAITATSYNISTTGTIISTSTTVATTNATTIESFAVASVRSARVQVQITQGTNYQASDILIIHDGATADIIEYGSVATNDYLGTFSAIVSGGNCLLRINMGSATSSTVKVLSQRITV